MPATINQSEEHTIAELLREWFYAPVPAERLIAQTVQDALAEAQREFFPLSGRPLGTVLWSADTAPAVLTALKNHAKRLAMREGNPTTIHHAALTLYFAAIASALVFHGEKISAHSHQTLERAFGELTARPWMTGELRDLLAQAQTICHNIVRKAA